MTQTGSIEKKIRKFNVKFDDSFVTSCHTFMANSRRVAIGDRIAHPGPSGYRACHWTQDSRLQTQLMDF
jgi:hypothetical protein